MDMKTIKCTSCGKETPVQESGKSFCMFCGAQLHMAEGDQPESRAERLIATIEDAYSAYDSWVREYSLKNGGLGKSFAAFFTGNSAFKNHENHAKFLDNIKSSAEDTISLWNSGKLSHTQLEKLLEFVLLDDHRNCVHESVWMYFAAERFFMPLIDDLGPDEAAVFYDRYRALRKKEPGFQVQADILKKLKKLRT